MRKSDGTVIFHDVAAYFYNHPESNFNFVDVDLMIAGYQAARDYADNNGLKIYNATRGGKLEVFERVDFGSLFI